MVQNVAKFETKANAPVTGISFSENGYFLCPLSIISFLKSC